MCQTKIQEYKDRSFSVHGSKYGYEYFKPKNTNSKVDLVCEEHGIFSVKLKSHFKGTGCPECRKERVRKKLAYTNEQFIKSCKIVHNNYFTYDFCSYINSKKPVIVTCPIHGNFSIVAGAHKQRATGCSKCSWKARGKSVRTTFEEFVSRAKSAHRDTNYKYHKDTYTLSNVETLITCPIHGDFKQLPFVHMNGHGCKECGVIKCANSRRRTTEEFVEKAKEVHGDRYIYDKVDYTGTDNRVKIKCKKHGLFTNIPWEHLNGTGCQKCSAANSQQQTDVTKYIKTKTEKLIIENDRKILNGRELDIYLPEVKLAIEYCGLYWHSENNKGKDFHYNKWKDCRDLGIKLVTIFEDEWLENENKVKISLDSFLGKKEKGTEGTIRKIRADEGTAFLNKYHLQGDNNASIYYGLQTGNRLSAVISFSKHKHGWELHRFCTDGFTRQGVAGTLWKTFVADVNPSYVMATSDRRWCTGDMYSELGFKLNGEVKPDYYYIKHQKRYCKSNFTQAGIKEKFPEVHDVNKTEIQMMNEAKYLRIWDCGKDLWVWINE